MTEIPDPVSAIASFLKSDEDVLSLTDSSVFRDEIPPNQTDSMPRKCVVVEPSGPGSFGSAFQDYADGRFDIRCYGESPFEAGRVQRAVYGALKHLRRQSHAGVLLHWARRSGGPLALRDPDTQWPYRFESFQVLVSEVEV